MYKHSRKKIMATVREKYGAVIEHIHYDELEEMLLEKVKWSKSTSFRQDIKRVEVSSYINSDGIAVTDMTSVEAKINELVDGYNTLLSELTKKPTANKKKDRPRVPTVTKPKKGKDKYYQENWDFNDIFEEIQLGITKSDDIRNRRLITDWLWRQYSKLSATQSNKPKTGKESLKELKVNKEEYERIDSKRN